MKKLGAAIVFCVLALSVMAFAAGHVGHVTPVVNPVVSLDTYVPATGYSTPAAAAASMSLTGVSADKVNFIAGYTNTSGDTYAQAGVSLDRGVYVLPIFSITVGTSTTAGVVTTGFAVSGDELVSADNESVASVKVIKILSDGSTRQFTRVETAAALQAAEGRFAILNANGSFPSAITKANTYQVYVSLKDGGSFDFDGTVNGTIWDPTCLGYKAVTGGGSSGGCSALGFAPMALLFLAPMALLARKRG